MLEKARLDERIAMENQNEGKCAIVTRRPAKLISPGTVLMLLAILVGVNAVLLAEDGEGVALTVYQDNLALVKDRRLLDLPAGTGTVSFADVAGQIDPTTVMFRSLTSPSVRVLEQNYEYDVINDEKLLQKYLGREILITTTQGENIEGYLLGAGANLIVGAKPDGGKVRMVRSGQIGAITFPSLPGGLVVRPTLVWLLANPDGNRRQLVEVTYLTGGISWRADYVATVSQDDGRVDLAGWVTLDNRSGADYREARLKLVAGEVNRIQDQKLVMEGMLARAAPQADGGFQEESFFEYHLYTLGRPATLGNNQIKQVELLNASSVPVRKLFLYEGARNPKIRVMLELINSTENNLGFPLPRGRVRVQKADSEGALQFIGEDGIDHTPRDEKVRLYLGNAFDLVGERIRTNVREVNRNTREESYQITLRNHKREAVAITVVEYMNSWHQWQITRADREYTKTEAGKVEFTVTVPAGGQAGVNYTVQYRW